MDRSKQRGDGTGDAASAVRISDSGASAASANSSNVDNPKPYFNAYAEASQARVVGEKPFPAICSRSNQSVPVTKIDANHKVTPGKPLSATRPYQKASVAAVRAKVLLPPVDDCSCETEVPVNPRLMAVGEVAAYLSTSASKVWRLQRNDPSFPRRIRIGGSTRWDRAAIDRYIDNLQGHSGSGR